MSLCLSPVGNEIISGLTVIKVFLQLDMSLKNNNRLLKVSGVCFCLAIKEFFQRIGVLCDIKCSFRFREIVGTLAQLAEQLTGCCVVI